MNSLRFIKLTADGQHLVFADSAGKEYSIEASADLLLALRKALAPISAASDEDLRPAQIQARLRAGMSVEQLVSDFGLDEARVRRFEGPVVQERAYVAQRSQRARIKGNTNEVTLGDQIEQLLLDRGQSADQLVWDATRGEETFWTISVTRGGAIAHFGFDSTSQSVWPLDDVARTLIGLAPTNSPRLVPVPSDTQKPTSIAPVPKQEPQVVKPEITTPIPVADSSTGVKPETVSSFDPDQPEPAITTSSDEQTAQKSGAKKSKRVSVPSWDEILFGGND